MQIGQYCGECGEDMELINKTIGQCLKEQAERNGRQAAMEMDGETWNFRQLDVVTDRMTVRLRELGVTHGTHVGIWSVNTPMWVALFLALTKMGAVPVLINTCYKAEEIKGILNYADVEILFYGIRYKTIVYEEIVEAIRKETPKVRHFIRMDSVAGLYEDQELTLNEAAVAEEVAASVKPEDAACMIFTSGTTSLPKGVMLSHYSLINNSRAMVSGMHWETGDRMCITVPLFHCFGITAGIIACVLGGITMYLIPYFKTIKVWEAIKNADCTILNGVPSMFLALIRKPEYEGEIIDTLKSGLVAGSPVTREEFLEICRRFPKMHLQPAFGQTETSPCVTLADWDEPNEVKAVSAGKLLEHVDLRIAALGSGKILGTNECGEIQVRGYNLMQGYYNLPQATASAFTEDGWLRTGDLGCMDEQGRLHITGRLKEIIIRAGENISPPEIEMVIRRLPWVADVKVIGVPATVLQEEIAACIVPKPGCEVNADEVRELVRKTLAHYKVPAYVLKFNEFPLNASGKIHLKVLKEQVIDLVNAQTEACDSKICNK